MADGNIKMLTEWEYKIKKVNMPSSFSDKNLESEYENMKFRHESILNELGKDGWEHYNTIGVYWYFKRCINYENNL